MRPSTTLCLKIDGEVLKSHIRRRQFDAFMNALAKYTKKQRASITVD
jgi:D-citramalate synthase